MAAVKSVFLIASCQPLLLEHSKRIGILAGRLTSTTIRDRRTISTSSFLCFGVPQLQHQSDIKTSRWHRAIAEADKLLGHPKLLLPNQMLPTSDVISMASQLNNIVEPNHPLLKIIERLIYGNDNMMPKGLIIMLLGKVISQLDKNTKETNEAKLKKQQSLATGVDLGHMSMQAHGSIANMVNVECDSTTRNRFDYANKVSILVGDLMLAKTNLLFGSIRNSEVVHIMASAVRDFVKGKFMFDQDDQGNAYPSKSTTIADWEEISFFTNASLLANSFKSLLLISNLDEDYQERGFEFGKLLGLAWQASAEIEQFVDNGENSSNIRQLSLVSCPIILHLQRDTSLLDLVTPYHKDLSKVDYKKIYEMVSDGPAIREAQEMCQNHVQGAINVLQQFPNSEHRAALENIVVSLEV